MWTPAIKISTALWACKHIHDNTTLRHLRAVSITFYHSMADVLHSDAAKWWVKKEKKEKNQPNRRLTRMIAMIAQWSWFTVYNLSVLVWLSGVLDDQEMQGCSGVFTYVVVHCVISQLTFFFFLPAIIAFYCCYGKQGKSVNSFQFFINSCWSLTAEMYIL